MFARYCLFLAIVMGAPVFAACGSQENSAHHHIVESVVLSVHGMTCGSCEKTIRTVVGGIPGVSEVVADHRKNTVSIKYDGTPATLAKIQDQIKSLGYKVEL